MTPPTNTPIKASGGVADRALLSSAGSVPAPLYPSGLSVQRHNQWSFYSSMEEVDQLIEALNPRGHREGGLKEALLQERDRLQLLLQTCNQNKYSHTGEPGHSCTAGSLPRPRLCSTCQVTGSRVTSAVMTSSVGPLPLSAMAAFMSGSAASSPTVGGSALPGAELDE